jgi:transposase
MPPDHLVRQVDGVLDLRWVHKELAPYSSHTGRPSIDPVLMILMLIEGYVFAIRSERRLCAEVQVTLAYRWFCRLGIEDKIPDHSVFCRARRERFRESDALRRVFEGVVAMCIAAELVGGEAFSIDASLINAEGQEKAGSGRIHFTDSAHSWVSRCFPKPSESSTLPIMPCHPRAGFQPLLCVRLCGPPLFPLSSSAFPRSALVKHGCDQRVADGNSA